MVNNGERNTIKLHYIYIWYMDIYMIMAVSGKRRINRRNGNCITYITMHIIQRKNED